MFGDTTKIMVSFIKSRKNEWPLDQGNVFFGAGSRVKFVVASFVLG